MQPTRSIRGRLNRAGALLTVLALSVLALPLVPLALMAAVPIFTAAKGVFIAATVHNLGILGLFAGRTAEVQSETRDTPSLLTKNRAANELRAQAQALRAEIMDTTKPMTTEELVKKGNDIKAIEARANVIAEFTGEDEVRRQGGTEGLVVPIAGVESVGDKRLNVRTTMQTRIEDFANRAISEFGDMRSYIRLVASGGKEAPRGGMTPAREALMKEADTLTRAIVGTAGDISGGEYLLPLTQVQSIFSLANVQQGLLQRARAYNVPGRTLRIPYLIQTDDGASTTLNRPMAGQIANVTIVGEGSTKPTRTPSFGQRLLTIYKYAAITQAGDETLQDDFTGELPAEFINAVGQQALNKVNEDITIDGSGSGEPTAALKASAAWNISVTRNTASTILPVDVFAMYARHTHGPNSFWLASRRTVQSLFNMSLTSASMVTFIQSLSAAPQMMLLGYPVILSDLLPTLGSAGDFALLNPDFYAFALRQALTVESSRDFAFTTDLTTYRFIVRAGGIPINTGLYAYKYAASQGVDEHSPFVYLT